MWRRNSTISEDITQVTEGSGKKLHTYNRTIGANLIQDQFVLPAEFPYASYTVIALGIVLTTANSHVLEIMAGSSLNVRVRRFEVKQAGLFTGAQITWSLFRLSSAGTGGSAVTPAKFNTADSSAGATAMTLPTVKGTETTQVMTDRLYGRTANGTTGGSQDTWKWDQRPDTEAFIIPAGTANGIAFKNITSDASGTVDIYVELVETAFV